METRIKKSDLITIVEKNREQHQAIFQEAVEGYRGRMKKVLTEHLDRVTSGSLERITVSLPAPENHLAEYDRALKMLELSEDSSVVLTEGDASRLMMDDWEWKHRFITTNSMYSQTAASITA